MALIQQIQPEIPDYLGTQIKRAQLQNYQNEQMKAQRENEKAQAINQVSMAAINGDPQAMQQLAAVDPDRAKKVFDYHYARSERAGAYASAIDQAPRERKAQVYQSVLNMAKNDPLVDQQSLSQFPDQYSPDLDSRLYSVAQSHRKIEDALKAKQEAANLTDTITGTGLKQAQTKTESFQQKNYASTTAKNYADLKKTNLESNALTQEQEGAAKAGLSPVAYKAQQSEFGKQRGEKVATLADMNATLPHLLENVNKLSDLGQKATYTYGGIAKDFTTRQLGMEVGEGAKARAAYKATVKDQILPLLKQTFGSQFTLKEGEGLESTLGDPNLSPSEKDAALKAFIEQKVATIKSAKSELGLSQDIPDIQTTGKLNLKEGKIVERPSLGEIFK